MKNKVNEHIIRIVGLANIPEALLQGHDYKVLLDGSVVEIAEQNNQDGSVNLKYKIKIFGECQVKELGKTPIKGTSKNYTPSQELRFALRRAWNEQNEGLPFDDYYNNRMDEIITEVKNEIYG